MPATDPSLGQALLQRGRWAIGHALGLPDPEPPGHPLLDQRGACFVTLKRADQLRGCIGTLQARRALADDVAENAVAAALHDHRFEPVGAEELPALSLEVSVLSRPEFLEVRDEAGVLAQLRPGIDGVIFFDGCRRATFLPQVWEQLPEPREFLGRLKEKAGLPAAFWGPNVMIATYQVEKFAEAESASAK